MGVLTRDEMEQVLADGGSVLHGRTVISSVDELPSAAELSRDDPEQLEHVRAALQAQRAALDAQLAAIDREGAGVPSATALQEGSPPAPQPEPEWPEPEWPEPPQPEPTEPEPAHGKAKSR